MSDKYSIEELSEITGFPRRTIRYYIQEGLIAPPAGRGRGGFYNDSHVNDLLRIKELQEKGFSLSTIAETIKMTSQEKVILHRDVWIRYEIIPGVEIGIRRDIEEKQHKKITELIRLAKLLLKGDE